MYLKLFALFLAAANAYFQLSLSGGILDSYYIATIYVGSPPQPRDVLIDTGSQLLTINCQVCTTCSVHPHPYFNRADSSSQQYVPCVTIAALRKQIALTALNATLRRNNAPMTLHTMITAQLRG